MRYAFYWFITLGLLATSVNLAIPIYLAMIAGKGEAILNMRSLFGKTEHVLDMVLITLVVILGVVVLIMQLRDNFLSREE